MYFVSSQQKRFTYVPLFLAVKNAQTTYSGHRTDKGL